MLCFMLIGYYATFNKGNNPIGKHFRMNTQFLMIFHGGQGCIGNSAYTHLKRCPIFYQASYILSNFHFHLIGNRNYVRWKGIINLCNTVKLTDMNISITVGSGHIGINFCYYKGSAFGGSKGSINGNT